MSKRYDVYGIGNPLVDLLVQVSDKLLENLQLNKGIMHLIDIERRSFILDHIPDPQISLGGSCANTIVSLADYGLSSSYGGGIGHDSFGDTFENGLLTIGVQSELKRKTLPTGSSIILISPDAERTQNTYLGSCQEFSVDDVSEEKIKQSEILYFTGYMWDTPSQKEALNYAIELAEAYNTKIIFDVADPFAVNRSKEDFLDIIPDHCDFVFANLDEAKALTGKTGFDETIEAFREIAPEAAIKDGKKGSYVLHAGETIPIPVFKVNAIDTTGAGDVYAAGFIYGLVKGYDMARSGRIASYVGGRVVEQVGATLSVSLRNVIDTI